MWLRGTQDGAFLFLIFGIAPSHSTKLIQMSLSSRVSETGTVLNTRDKQEARTTKYLQSTYAPETDSKHIQTSINEKIIPEEVMLLKI